MTRSSVCARLLRDERTVKGIDRGEGLELFSAGMSARETERRRDRERERERERKRKRERESRSA